MSDAGWVELEQRCPTTYCTPSLTSRLATVTACLGSQTSSTSTATRSSPITPPAALMRSMAMREPENCMSPYWATGPVMGPAIPILISAAAWPAAITATEAPTAVTSFLTDVFIVFFLFMSGLFLCSQRLKKHHSLSLVKVLGWWLLRNTSLLSIVELAIPVPVSGVSRVRAVVLVYKDQVPEILMVVELLKTRIHGCIVLVCFGDFNRFFQSAYGIFPAANLSIGAGQLVVGMAVIRSQPECPMAQADGPQGFAYFEHGIGLIAQGFHIIRPQVENLVIGGNFVLLGGFLACLEPERVHFVGALNFRLVLMNNLGFLLQLFFNKLQPLFVFHHQFVYPFFGQAGELVAHVANGIPADDDQDRGGAGNQIEEVGHRVNGIRHGFVSHG